MLLQIVCDKWSEDGPPQEDILIFTKQFQKSTQDTQINIITSLQEILYNKLDDKTTYHIQYQGFYILQHLLRSTEDTNILEYILLLPDIHFIDTIVPMYTQLEPESWMENPTIILLEILEIILPTYLQKIEAPQQWGLLRTLALLFKILIIIKDLYNVSDGLRNAFSKLTLSDTFKETYDKPFINPRIYNYIHEEIYVKLKPPVLFPEFQYTDCISLFLLHKNEQTLWYCYFCKVLGDYEVVCQHSVYMSNLSNTIIYFYTIVSYYTQNSDTAFDLPPRDIFVQSLLLRQLSNAGFNTATHTVGMSIYYIHII